MKKYVIIFLLILLGFPSYAEEDAIILEPDVCLEKSINLDTPNTELLERGVQKLNNNGVILQNSISPVNGLIYNSTSIPTERKTNETTKTNDE